MTEKNTPLQIFPCQRVDYVVSIWRTSSAPALVLLLLMPALCWACFVPSTTLPAATVVCHSSSEALLSFLTSPVFIVMSPSLVLVMPLYVKRLSFIMAQENSLGWVVVAYVTLHVGPSGLCCVWSLYVVTLP